MIDPVAQELDSSTPQTVGRSRSAAERRVCELIAGDLLSADECQHAPEVALCDAAREERLSFDRPWLRPEDIRYDEGLKDMVRHLLGMPTASEMRDARELQRVRFERALERHRLKHRPRESDRRTWAVIGAWELTGTNADHARSMLTALGACTSRRAGRIGRYRNRSRRPRACSCRRGTRSTRAGPGDSEGEPHLANRHTAALRWWEL